LPPEAEFVFGYGSLAGDPRGAPARLPGYRRTWGTAMDNSEDLAGYKHYETSGGERPAVRVCFLDLEPDPRSTVEGLALPVSGPGELDARERNYVRREVSELIEGVEGRVWTYFGSPEGRRRRREGTAVISREYLELVERALGHSLATDGLPVWDLVRVDHP
jgi:hypothetical protein